jgi:hypothetical protein
MQRRGAVSGRCAVREDRGQKRALWGKSHWSGHRYMWTESRGLRKPGYKDDLTDPSREHQGGVHCEAWPQLQLRGREEHVGATVSRAGRVYAAFEQKWHLYQRCADTYPRQCC